jgi:hypothetical protein
MRVPVLLVTLVASLIFISSCQPYQVIPLTKADPKKLKDRPLIYALPKTLLRIEINTEKHIWKAGPLAIWSYKYM